LVTRDGSLVVEAMKQAQSLFPWLLRGVDFDNDSAFMNDVVVPWCREQKLEVTRSRAYKKNDSAFVEQKNGAVVRLRPHSYSSQFVPSELVSAGRRKLPAQQLGSLPHANAGEGPCGVTPSWPLLWRLEH
jgi:hypothetical protein